MIILATDIEKVDGEHGLDQYISKMLQACRN